MQSPTERMHSLEYESQLVETLLELFAAQYRIQPLIRAALCALCHLYLCFLCPLYLCTV